MADERLVDKKGTFSSFSHILDSRILRALADAGFARPTLVQTKAIPLALKGKDILARARTGSGKTAAYCVPVVQKILNAKSVSILSFVKEWEINDYQALDIDDSRRQATRALILVPTKELAEQVSGYLRTLLVYCDTEITTLNAASGTTNHLQR
jgi:ATP-dependent RNA helicase DDX56/DBP9